MCKAYWFLTYLSSKIKDSRVIRGRAVSFFNKYKHIKKILFKSTASSSSSSTGSPSLYRPIGKSGDVVFARSSSLGKEWKTESTTTIYDM